MTKKIWGDLSENIRLDLPKIFKIKNDQISEISEIIKILSQTKPAFEFVFLRDARIT